MKYQIKHDSFSSARGGWSRVLAIHCEHCRNRLCFYQKDGPGALRRLYLDRMIGLLPKDAELYCSGCNRVLGTKIVYEKESRIAYRLYADAVIKKVVAKNLLDID